MKMRVEKLEFEVTNEFIETVGQVLMRHLSEQWMAELKLQQMNASTKTAWVGPVLQAVFELLGRVETLLKKEAKQASENEELRREAAGEGSGDGSPQPA